MRVYVPSSPRGVAQALAAGRFPAGQAFGVTPGLRALDPESDEEEHEFLASMLAADASLVQQTEHEAEPADPLRRVVVAVDVPDDEVAVVDDATGELQVAVELPLPWVAAVHVDDAAAEAVVRQALLDGELDPLDDLALAWFDPTELPMLVHDWGLGPGPTQEPGISPR
jgi:hypothetical protein